jgi:hypothetical protein
MSVVNFPRGKKLELTSASTKVRGIPLSVYFCNKINNNLTPPLIKVRAILLTVDTSEEIPSTINIGLCFFPYPEMADFPSASCVSFVMRLEGDPD